MIRLSRRMVFVASNMSASTSCLRSAPGSRLVSAFNAALDNHSIVFARRSSPADSEHANGRDQTTVDNGGEGGIRTHGTRKGSTVFETARFNRSRTSPYLHSTWFPNHLREVSPTGFLLQNRQCHHFGTIPRNQPNRPPFCFAVRVGIAHRHRHRRMAKQLLHRHQVSTIS